MVLLQAKTVPEKLLIPAFLYFFLMLYPPKWIADRKSKTAGAAGGCIVLRKAALERIGGISAIRGEVIDDCALAREVKRSGGSVWMGLTRKSVSLRAYSNFGEIRDLVARTAFTQLGYSSVVLLGTILGMLLTYLVPVVFSFHSDPLVWRLSLATWALMTRDLSSYRAILWTVTAMGSPVARGSVVLLLRDLAFGGALLDGSRRAVEGPGPGSRETERLKHATRAASRASLILVTRITFCYSGGVWKRAVPRR